MSTAAFVRFFPPDDDDLEVQQRQQHLQEESGLALTYSRCLGEGSDAEYGPEHDGSHCTGHHETHHATGKEFHLHVS